MFNDIIKVGILDNHILFRDLLIKYLESQKRILVRICASNLYELKTQLPHEEIDILLLRIDMPGIFEEKFQEIIINRYPLLKVIVLPMFENYDVLARDFDVEIRGFVLKVDNAEDLVNSIYMIGNNKLIKNPILDRTQLWKRQKINVSNSKGICPLTEREINIIQLLWEEKSNEEIANILYLGVRSIEKIRQQIKEKLGAKSTIGILKYAISHAILNASLSSEFSFMIN